MVKFKHLYLSVGNGISQYLQYNVNELIGYPMDLSSFKLQKYLTLPFIFVTWSTANKRYHVCSYVLSHVFFCAITCVHVLARVFLCVISCVPMCYPTVTNG
jgi:hypothetical protein